MVLIVLTDSDPFAATKRLVARVGFVLIPASVLLIKYYPALGRVYNIWTWEPMFVGVTEHKNTLGMLCMVLGLGFEWRFLLAYRDRRRPEPDQTPDGLRCAPQHDSVALLAGQFRDGAIVFAAWNPVPLREPVLEPSAENDGAPICLLAALVAVPFATLFMGIGGSALEGMGRDATLTGRTEIWKDVLSMSGNPIIGTGFESFWIGQRADRMWRMFYFHPTQAHNGYLEVYLELGWIGIALLAGIIVTGCRNAVATLRRDPETGRIRLAYIVVALAYNMTEAGFRMMTLTWFFFLLSAVVVPVAVAKAASLPLPAAPPQNLDEWQLQGDPVPDFARRQLEAF